MAEPKKRLLSELKKLPNNPRTIKDESFKSLCKSIQDNPDYFEARPCILSDRTGELIIIAGNQRYDAAKYLKLKEIPTHLISGLTEDREQEIIIRDNVANGEWDVSALTEWDKVKLEEWGVILPTWAELPTDDELIGEEKNKPATMKITFPTPEDLQKCESEIQEVINRLCPKAFYSVSAGEI
jgi:hypothetical protein